MKMNAQIMYYVLCIKEKDICGGHVEAWIITLASKSQINHDNHQLAMEQM